MFIPYLLVIFSMYIGVPIAAAPLGDNSPPVHQQPISVQVHISVDGVPVSFAQHPVLDVIQPPAVIEDGYIPIGLGADRFQVDSDEDGGFEEIDKELEKEVAPEGYQHEEDIDTEQEKVVAPEGYHHEEEIDKEQEKVVAPEGYQHEEEIETELEKVVAPKEVEEINKELEVVVQPLELPDLEMQGAKPNVVFTF